MLHLLRHGASVYSVSSKGPTPTSHSGIRTRNIRIIRSLCVRSNLATRARKLNILTDDIYLGTCVYRSRGIKEGRNMTTGFDHLWPESCQLEEHFTWKGFKVELWAGDSDLLLFPPFLLHLPTKCTECIFMESYPF
jgi:hypothetical protein